MYTKDNHWLREGIIVEDNKGLWIVTYADSEYAEEKEIIGSTIENYGKTRWLTKEEVRKQKFISI